MSMLFGELRHKDKYELEESSCVILKEGFHFEPNLMVDNDGEMHVTSFDIVMDNK